MSADKPRRMVELWGGIIAVEEEDPDSKEAIFRRAINASTDTFVRHKAALLNHLQHRLQHAGHGAERRILPFGEATEPVEMPE